MLLKLGSTGEDVKKLQQKLGLEVNGSFDAKTEAKVKTWQKENGLKDDGVVGDISWKKLFPLDISKLKGVIPDTVLSQIPAVMEKFQINNALRLSHFLSQCSHESGDFRLVKENLNYSAQGLANTWPTRFAKDPKAKVKVPNDTAVKIERKPELIANTVYANRMGNSATNAHLYIGRGYIQLTGLSNYSAFDSLVPDDIVGNPELVATKYPLLSAAYFFSKNGLNAVSDLGATPDVVKRVTKLVNGGSIGLADREKHFNEYYKLLK